MKETRNKENSKSRKCLTIIASSHGNKNLAEIYQDIELVIKKIVKVVLGVYSVFQHSTCTF